MSKMQSPQVSRRRFIAGLGSAGAVTVASTVLPPQRPVPRADSPPGDAQAPRSGYQLTRHVLRYYQTARV